MTEANSADQIWLLRHAESTWNAAGFWQGWGDPPLSERGCVEATHVAQRLLERNFSTLVASDLKRAVETARIFAEILQIPLSVDRRLREHDVGEWTGLSHAEIEKRWPEDYASFRSGNLELRPGGGECRLALAQRVRPCVEDIARRYAGQNVLVVTHAGVIRSLVPDATPQHLREVLYPRKS